MSSRAFSLLLAIVIALSSLQLAVAFARTQHRLVFREQRRCCDHSPLGRAAPISPLRLRSSVSSDDNTTTSRRLAYLVAWVSFVTYAFTMAPGSSADATALDNEMIKTMISTPFDGSISPIFVALFNSLGVLPAIYASLLLPGGKAQKVPALPFVVSSFALGFFGIGPYLGLRSINTDVTTTTRGRGSGAFEFKGASIGMLAFSVYLLYYAVLGDFDGDRVQSFVQLFNNQKLAHVSSLDFTILSVALADPLREDMKRRNFEFNPIFLFPVFGPVFYLILRPSLKD